jgi:hypothetical protein
LIIDKEFASRESALAWVEVRLPIWEVERPRIAGEAGWGRSADARHPWLDFRISEDPERDRGFGGVGAANVPAFVRWEVALRAPQAPYGTIGSWLKKTAILTVGFVLSNFLWVGVAHTGIEFDILMFL